MKKILLIEPLLKQQNFLKKYMWKINPEYKVTQIFNSWSDVPPSFDFTEFDLIYFSLQNANEVENYNNLVSRFLGKLIINKPKSIDIKPNNNTSEIEGTLNYFKLKSALEKLNLFGNNNDIIKTISDENNNQDSAPTNEVQKIIVDTEESLYFLEPKAIVKIEINGISNKFHLTGGEIIKSRKKVILNEIEFKKLGFVRVNDSLLINKNQVEQIIKGKNPILKLGDKSITTIDNFRLTEVLKELGAA